MISRSDAVVVTVAGSAGGVLLWQWLSASPDAVRSLVVSELDASMRVQSFTLNTPADYIGSYVFTAAVRVVPLSDYANANDVASVVRNAFYEATGYLPTVDVADVIAGGAADVVSPGGIAIPGALDLNRLLAGAGFGVVAIGAVAAVVLWKTR